MRLGSATRAASVALALLAGAAGCHPRDEQPLEQSSPTEHAIPSGATLVASETAKPAPTPAPPPELAVRAEPVSFAPIAHVADPSVVTITTKSEEVEISPFTHRRRSAEMRGLGTGFVVDKGGVVLTNNHVVEGATSIQVKLFDERELPGRVAGTDPLTDIAVVKIDAPDLRPIPLGDSDGLDVGDWVVAIGNPFGLSHTVSAGIISAKGRTHDDVPLDPSGYYDFLQTDASINPGNSGGPLLNLRGQAVGVNTAIRAGGAQGIGFAIPINMVKQLLPMLLRDGRVTRSALGVRIADVRQLGPDDRAALGIADGQRVAGAVVEYVAPGASGAKAGIEPGDLIVAFEGQPIERSTQLQWLASTAGVGRSVTVRVSRRGKVFDTPVTLGQLEEQSSSGERR